MFESFGNHQWCSMSEKFLFLGFFSRLFPHCFQISSFLAIFASVSEQICPSNHLFLNESNVFLWPKWPIVLQAFPNASKWHKVVCFVNLFPNQSELFPDQSECECTKCCNVNSVSAVMTNSFLDVGFHGFELESPQTVKTNCQIKNLPKI